jgi:hypothetical protein
VNRHIGRRRVAPVAAAFLALLLASGIAYAYWTVNGSGSGTAPVAAGVSDVTVNQTTVLNAMYPGDSAQTISGNFDNANTGPVYVTTVTVSIDSVDKDPSAPAGTCDATDFTLASAVVTVNAEIPAGAGVGSWTGPTIQFNNKASNQDACKGATVNLAYSIP